MLQIYDTKLNKKYTMSKIIYINFRNCRFCWDWEMMEFADIPQL